MEKLYIVYIPKTNSRKTVLTKKYACELAQDCAIDGYEAFVFEQADERAREARSLYYFNPDQPDLVYNVPNKYVMDDRAVWYTGFLKKGGVNNG